MQGIIELIDRDLLRRKTYMQISINNISINKLEELNNLKGKDIDIEIKKHREKRSLDANSYCWVLCDEIAKELSKDGAVFSKEDVYKEHIRIFGTFIPTIVTEVAFESFKEIWEKQGLGYQVEETSRKDKCIRINCYYGSSSYNTKEMSRLIESLVGEAQELGIETKPKEEIEAMLNEIEKNESSGDTKSGKRKSL